MANVVFGTQQMACRTCSFVFTGSKTGKMMQQVSKVKQGDGGVGIQARSSLWSNCRQNIASLYPHVPEWLS